MPDFGHELEFGCFLTPSAERHRAVLATVRDVEEMGLDLLAIQDHPYQASFLDAWTLLSHAAALTTRLRFFPDVANLPLRPPAVLARSAASLDVLTGGRVELGLGTGGFWDAIEAMGGERRTPGAAVEALEEAIAVIRALWTPGRTPRIDGEHYRLHGAKPGPVPPHPIGIWLGAYKPRMLRLTGRLADGWLPSSGYASPDQLARLSAIVDGAAVAAGRDPGDVRRLYNIGGRFTSAAASDGSFLVGPPEQWVEQLTEVALRHGFSGFVLAAEPGETADLRRFAAEVAPAVREAVATERGVGEEAEADAIAAVYRGTAGAGVGAGPSSGAFTASASSSTSDPARVRPHGPAFEITRDQGSVGYSNRVHLVQVHNHLRKEFADLRRAVVDVLEGRGHPAAARSLLNQMTMRQNYWTLGAFCAGYNRLVTTHHLIEDQHMFPAVLAADARLQPVVDQLSSEHEHIGELITRLDMALVAMVEDPTKLEELERVLERLGESLFSHLDYEEDELLDVIEHYGLVL